MSARGWCVGNDEERQNTANLRHAKTVCCLLSAPFTSSNVVCLVLHGSGIRNIYAKTIAGNSFSSKLGWDAVLSDEAASLFTPCVSLRSIIHERGI